MALLWLLLLVVVVGVAAAGNCNQPYKSHPQATAAEEGGNYVSHVVRTALSLMGRRLRLRGPWGLAVSPGQAFFGVAVAIDNKRQTATMLLLPAAVDDEALLLLQMPP